MASRSFRALGPHGFHRVAYTEWGVADNPRVLLCVHGLTRNGRDFDPLARALQDSYRVICPDIVGRGDSDWLGQNEGYGYPQYCADMAALIARMGVEEVYWLGTSMGGIIGMLMASKPHTPVQRLLLNDIGPHIPAAALRHIGSYAGADPVFADLDAAAAYFREVYAGFGDLTDAQWRHMVGHGVRQRGDGTYGLNYDPAIGTPFRREPIRDVDMWVVWDAVTCPTLVIRGAKSDLLRAETACEMTRRGPSAEIIELSGFGHAAALMSTDQISVVRDWLRRAHAD